MTSNFNSSMFELRNDLLKDIYRGESITEAELSITNLSIYSRNNSLFSRLNRAMNISTLDNSITLTDEQVECINLLNEGNLFLSAPTSFGKTFIAFEYIARYYSKLNNIVFVVPTISLMNEIRKKCFQHFREKYILITSDAELDQYYDEVKKIMIVVPERISTFKFKQYINENMVDLLVYDEIYKLKYESNEKDSNDRIIRMNYIYKYLIERSSRILLLGPFIKNVHFNKSDLKIKKYITNLNLVYNEIEFCPNTTLEELIYNDDKKFVFFSTPNSIHKYLSSNNILDDKFPQNEYDNDIIQWISDNIHPSWYYSTYLKKGVGIHHGKTPMFLRKYIEQEYGKRNGSIHTILCTSTLMEGINTPTNKLIIYETPRGTFELNNLIGRVGRLNPVNPNMGKVYVLDEKAESLYNPEDWIELNILYESERILTASLEDEVMYLDKRSDDGLAEKNIEDLEIILNRYGIKMFEVIEAGIEFSLLSKFMEIFDDITNYDREREVIADIKFKLLREYNTYLSGLKTDNYEFNCDDEYIFDAVYSLMANYGKMKPVINKFENQYIPNEKDINLFIDTLFQIDEFIKFKMMKIVPIYELFNKKNIFDKTNNRAFIQSVYMIESYMDASDGYERILTDIGIPKQDIVTISNELATYNELKGTELKLKKVKTKNLFNALSPFSKRIIDDL